MFSFNTRVSRKTYFIRLFLSTGLFIGLAVLLDLLPENEDVRAIAVIAILIAGLVWCIYLILLMKQRANDIGEHEWLLTALAFSTPFSIVLGFIPGQKQANKFGHIPR